MSRMSRIFCAIFLLFIWEVQSLSVRNFPLLMPNVHPDRDELYLCTPVKIVPNKTFYIVGFDPNATMHTVHHMMLFGCPRPGADKAYWDCGEMSVTDFSKNLVRANPCMDESHVLYAWARNAKMLKLPPDVGFQVGEGTEIQYLVLQVHYSKKFPDDAKPDNSGLSLMYTEEIRSRLAGVVLLGTGGKIPPHNVTYMEASCRINESKTIYPFAYRTHTHSLGKVVSGYRVRNFEGEDQWTLLGKRDPLTPQMFYDVANYDPIVPGDILAARCTMKSERDETTYVGPTNKDEMCNFYLMYYVKEGTPLNMKYCITSGPPNYKWNLTNIPNDASTL